MKLLPPSRSSIAIACGLAIALSAISLPASAERDRNIRQGLPGRRISGGVRSGCLKNYPTQSLVSMTPRNLLGKTAQAHPAFWFSLPKTPSAKSISFHLFNASDALVYSTQIEQIAVSGLSKVALPETVPALKVGENYRWVFGIRCDNNSDTSSLEVQGWVRRVELSSALRAQIASASLLEQAYLYEEAGLWHEQIETLAELRDRSPESLNAQLKWAALVQSAGLDPYISANPVETVTTLANEPVSTPRF